MNPLRSEEGLWRTRYKSFIRLYKGRDDVIAEWQGAAYAPALGRGLTLERFVDHVQMKKTFAIYNKDDAGMVSFGLYDVDIFPRDQEWANLLSSMEEKKRETTRIMETLADVGLERSNMLIEFPTVGFHLLIFFDKPVSARALKTLMRFVLKRSGLEQTPYYPRKVEEAPWGDRVQLPLRINLNTSRRSNFVRDLAAFDPENYAVEPDWATLEQVVPINSEWVSRMIDKFGLGK